MIQTNMTVMESKSLVRQVESYIGVVYYFILIIGGTLGNILGLFVIRSARTMHTTKGVFTSLMVADTVALWINPVRYWIIYVFLLDIRTLSDGWCKVQTFASYTSRDAATWILVLMTFERFVLAYSPNRCHEMWKPRQKILASLLVLGMLILKNCPVLFKLRVIKNDHGRLLCDTGDVKFRIAFFYLDITVYSLIPSLILVVCNAGLLRLLRKARDHRQSLLNASIECPVSSPPLQNSPPPGGPSSSINRLSNEDDLPAQTSKSRKQEKLKPPRSQTAMDKSVNQANRLLIPVSMFHLLTSMPLCVFSIVEASLHLKMSPNQATVDTVYSLGAFFSMLTVCNNGVNCIIYFLSSLFFRIILRRFFRSLFFSNSRTGRKHNSNQKNPARRPLAQKHNCIPLRITFNR